MRSHLASDRGESVAKRITIRLKNRIKNNGTRENRRGDLLNYKKKIFRRESLNLDLNVYFVKVSLLFSSLFLYTSNHKLTTLFLLFTFTLIPVAIPLSKAIKEWETRNSKVAAEEREIMLYGGLVFDTKRSFINKLDATLASLKNCERLALSTNQIDRMAPFTGMEKLRLLSLSRNAIKKIERLEDVAETLEELWMSYNQVSSLDGLGSCSKLQVLYLGNNKITDWNELDKLAGLPSLREVLFTGNPIYDGMEKAAAKLQVIKRIPNIQKVDNDMVSPGERDAAKAL